MKEKRNIHELIVREEPHLHEILDPEQVTKFKELTKELRDTWTKKQMFRTKTEMEFSVLNDAKYPTNAAKYWQCVREQNTHMENLMQLSFDARKNDIEIKQVAYVGNDINDKDAMEIVGFSFCPADAHETIIEISDHVFKRNGGDGVIRELLDLIKENI